MTSLEKLNQLREYMSALTGEQIDLNKVHGDSKCIAAHSLDLWPDEGINLPFDDLMSINDTLRANNHRGIFAFSGGDPDTHKKEALARLAIAIDFLSTKD